MMISAIKKMLDPSVKVLKRADKLADEVIALEPHMQGLTDEQLQNKTLEFKERIEKGETLDDLLVEAFAVVREASTRVLGMKPYKVQIIGGIALHGGNIAEMRTGEGKTLTSTMPAYLNALEGKGVHLITVNDYLAKRDSVWMGKLYKFLGLSVGLVVSGMNHEQKKKAYAADITYGTNNEFGFDYLRDNMAMSKNDMVQRDLNYAIVDEIDSILIDEARTPLIISGMVDRKSDLYERANKFAKNLKAKVIVENNDRVFDDDDNKYDYIVDLKAKTVALTETGTKKAEEFFGIEDLSDISNLAISHHINQAIRAYGIMKKDTDYIVRDGQVLIVDEFTGRIMQGRRYSDGLHQAIEAKENVKIASESQTLATITFQNYFRLYHKLAGMTGTAKTEEDEFKGIYKLDIVEIPTNKEVIRKDLHDVIYKTQKAKYNAIVEDVKESYEKGQPVLVGTVSIDKSEIISNLLKKQNIPHQVLNAKHHEKEAEIVAQAGKYKAVTIATNMAGRGTDIKLGGNLEYIVKEELAKKGYTSEVIEMAVTPIAYDNEEVKKAKEAIKEIEEKYEPELEDEKNKVIEAGGLKIIGSERHESRRIDNQLRGRAGRQGDPGSSKFYISLEDDLMKLFGSDKMMTIVDALGLPEDMPIEQKMLTNTIESAQKKVEGRNFTIRKNVLEYDDVMNKQREIIYAQRKEVLNTDDISKIVMQLARPKVKSIVDTYVSHADNIDAIDFTTMNTMLSSLFAKENIISKEDIEILDNENVENILMEKIEKIYEDKHKEAKELKSEEILNNIERFLILNTVNEKWMDHIDAISQLKEGIGLRAYGQTNPIEAYKIECFNMFEDLVSSIQEDATKAVFSLRAQKQEKYNNIVREESKSNIKNISTNENGNTPVKRKPVRAEKKIGRNEPCICRKW